MHHLTDRITYSTAFITPVAEHWREREIAQWVRYEGSSRRPLANALTMELHHTPFSYNNAVAQICIVVIACCQIYDMILFFVVVFLIQEYCHQIKLQTESCTV